MNIFERPRWAVFTQRQHPYRHDLTEFFYSNPAVPLPVNNTKEALDYLFGVIYPNYIGTYDTPADLPVSANANDYAVVTDDGDGKSAGYVWLVLNGVAGWNKKYDVDWSMEAILAEAVNRTMYMYVHKYGLSDKDASGAAITGLYAGQSIYGGDTSGQNLTLFPNSGNTLGGYSGYVQTEGDVRPTEDDEFTLGTAANRWADLRAVLATIGDISIAAGSIAAAGGAISFGSNDLSTTGDIEGDDVTGSRLLASVGANVLTITPSSVESSTGAISFGANDLSTTGDLAAMTLLLTESTSTLSLDPLSAGAALIVSSTGTINFGTNALGGISSLTATGAATAASGTFGDITVGVTSRKITTTAGNLLIGAFANVVFEDNDVVFDSVAGFLYDRSATNLDGSGITARFANLTLASATLASTAGNILLDPASAVLQVDGDTRPFTDAARSLGAAGARWVDLYLSGSIGNGTDAISIGTLVSFRDANTSVNVGDALFWDGTKWAPSSPDTEIDHDSLSGLTTGDAGHTQFALLAGRAGGQTLIGGTAASNNLTLQSTANATRGSVLFADPAAPSTDDATDFGLSGNRWKDLYTSGQFYGARLENRTSDPSFSAANVGRLIFRTDLGVVKIDTGSAWINVGTIALTTVGGTSNANGATVSLGVLQLHPADGTYPGVMTAGTQTLGGAKTWNGNQSFVGTVDFDSVLGPTTTGDNVTLATPTKVVSVLGDSALNSVAGITGPGFANYVIFANKSGDSIIWRNNSGSASVGNRLNTGGADYTQVDGSFLSFVYDTANAVWIMNQAGMTNPMTTAGDLIYGGSSGLPTRLAATTAGSYLRLNSSGVPAYNVYTTQNLTTTGSINNGVDRVFVQNTITATLPDAATNAGLIMAVIKADSDFDVITLARSGSDVIGFNGTTYTSVTLNTVGETWLLMATLSGGWQVVGRVTNTPWVAFTPTLNSNTSVAGNQAWWRRVGDSMELRYATSYNGVGANSTYTASLPSGPQIDTGKLALSNTLGYGDAMWFDNGVGWFSGSVILFSATSLSVQMHGSGSNFNTNTTANLDNISMNVTFPITGWFN